MSLQEQFSNERAWRKGPGIADGADVEIALLGSPAVSQKEKQEEYMSFNEAIEFVKEHQPNPFDRPRFVTDLRRRVAMLAGDTSVAVKFFTAVGTPLDIYHGIDAFFEQGGRIATIDVSLREKETQKANVLIVATLDKEGQVSVSEDEIVRAAQQIALCLNGSPQRKAA